MNRDGSENDVQDADRVCRVVVILWMVVPEGGPNGDGVAGSEVVAIEGSVGVWRYEGVEALDPKRV